MFASRKLARRTSPTIEATFIHFHSRRLNYLSQIKFRCSSEIFIFLWLIGPENSLALLMIIGKIMSFGALPISHRKKSRNVLRIKKPAFCIIS